MPDLHQPFAPGIEERALEGMEIVTGVALPGIEAEAPERPFSFIGRLVANALTRPPADYREKAGRDVIKWTQVFEALDVVRPDGTPAIFRNRPTAYVDGLPSGGPEPARLVLAKAWRGVVGIPMDPQDPASKSFLGHVFRLEGVRVGRGQFAVRLYLPVEHLGRDYQYVGEKRVVTPREADDDRGGLDIGALVSEAATASVSEEEKAQRIVSLVRGLRRQEAEQVLVSRSLDLLSPVFGIDLHAAIARGNFSILDLLVEKGFLVVDADGRYRAEGD